MPDIVTVLMLVAIGAMLFYLGRQSVLIPIERREDAAQAKRDDEFDARYGIGQRVTSAKVAPPTATPPSPPPPSGGMT